MQHLGAFMRTYWTRGVPGRPTPRSVQVLLYRWWIAAFIFKIIGSSWDVSWHFKWLRDDLAPPHLINTVGTGIAIVLVLTHSFTGYGMDKLSLRITQLGTLIFVIAAPIDVINHRLNGLDLTAWSPSHGMLYFGTAVMLAGVIRGWYVQFPRDGKHRREWVFGLTALWVFFFENAHFAQLQQEYGIEEIASWFRGTPYGEGELLNFAAAQLGRGVDAIALQHFALPIAPWVYPIWATVVCAPLLVFARHMVGKFWTATVVTAVYVLYRSVMKPLLVVGTFPPSVIPFWLVGLGVAVDLVFLLKLGKGKAAAYLQAAIGGAAVAAAGYGLMYLQNWISGAPLNLGTMTIQEMEAAYAGGTGEYTLDMPPVEYGSIFLAMIGSAVVWVAVTWVVSRSMGLNTPRPPAIRREFAAEATRDEHGLLVPFDEQPGRAGQPDQPVQPKKPARPGPPKVGQPH